MHGIPNKRRRRSAIRNMTMRQASMILLTNAFVGWNNADGSACRPWPDADESASAASMIREVAMSATERGE